MFEFAMLACTPAWPGEFAARDRHCCTAAKSCRHTAINSSGGGDPGGGTSRNLSVAPLSSTCALICVDGAASPTARGCDDNANCHAGKGEAAQGQQATSVDARGNDSSQKFSV